MNYEAKYYKYKNKYIQLKGGASISDTGPEYVLVFISGNKNKILEVSTILGENYPFLTFDIDIEEIQSVSVEKVAEQKAIDSYKVFQNSIDNLYILKDDDQEDIKITNLISGQKFIVFCEDTGLGFESHGFLQR